MGPEGRGGRKPPSGSSPRWKQVRCRGTRSRSACSRFRHAAGSRTCWTASSSNCASTRGPAARPRRAVSEVAGTLAAKRTAELIPLCHPLGLDHVEVDATLDEGLPGVRVRAAAKAVGRTGVEMEALTAVSVALLTVYDMVKAADRGMEIEKVRLLEKTGGTRGDWRRDSAD